MITTLHRAGQHSAPELPVQGRVARAATGGQSFLSESLAAMGASARSLSTSVPAPDARQNVATPTTNRQIPAAPMPQAWEAIFNGSPQPAVVSPETKQATVAAPVAQPVTATTPALHGDDAIVQSLKDALAAAGIGVEGLGLASHQDVVTYPGGSYINRYISVNTNGHEEGLMTDLVAINPKIAVLDIKHMLGSA